MRRLAHPTAKSHEVHAQRAERGHLNIPLEPVTLFIDKGVVHEITTRSKPKRPPGCLLTQGYPFTSPLFRKLSVFLPTSLRAPVRPWWWKLEGLWNWAGHGAKRLCTSCIYVCVFIIFKKTFLRPSFRLTLHKGAPTGEKMRDRGFRCTSSQRLRSRRATIGRHAAAMVGTGLGQYGAALQCCLGIGATTGALSTCSV